MNFYDIFGSVSGFFKLFLEYWLGCDACIEGFSISGKLDTFAILYAVWGLLLFALVHLLCRFLLAQVPAVQDDEFYDGLNDDTLSEDDQFDEDDQSLDVDSSAYSEQIEDSFKTPYVLPISLLGGGFIICISAVLLEFSFWVMGSRSAHEMGDAYSTLNAMLLFCAVTGPLTALQEIVKFIKAAVEKITSAWLSPGDKIFTFITGLGFLYLYCAAYFDVLHIAIGAPYWTIFWATVLPILAVIALLAPIGLLFFRKIRRLRSVLRI